MTLQVDPSNENVAAGWNGRDGAHWVRYADIYDRSITQHHEALLAAAAIAPTDRVLDIGCGNGLTSCDAARAARDGSVLAVDISTQMLATARRRAAEAGLTNVEFVNADAQIHPFPRETFDVAMSRFGVMFFGDPDAAFANIAGALKPGGRVAFMAWQSPAVNEFFGGMTPILLAGRPAPPPPPPNAPSPFSLADPDRVRALLGGAGLTDIELRDQRAPLAPGSTLDEAYEFVSSVSFVQPLLEGLDADTREKVLGKVRGWLAAHDRGDGVAFDSAAWIITARKS